jgi:hypothetical protein
VELEPLATLGRLLVELLPGKVPLADLASALVFDLRWVRAVLAEHLATRASTASLSREDTHLASLADDLATDLAVPVAEMMRVGES